MIYFLYFVHISTCFFLIGVVLLQQGKGADLAVFGGGATQAAFGARSAATMFHKLTVGFFVLFIMTTLSIGILQRDSGGSSIMSDVEATAPAEAPTDTASDTAEPVPESGVAPTTDAAAEEDLGAAENGAPN